MFKKLFLITAAVGLFASTPGVLAKDGVKKNDAKKTAAKPADTDKKDASKLVKVMTLQQAFAGSLQRRQQLGTRLVAVAKELQAEKDDAKKKELRQDFDKTNQALQNVKVAMEVIFGIGNRREYAYIADTIYLKVGTVEETFARAVKTREMLKQAIVKKTAEKNKAKDPETIGKLTEEIKVTTKRYQLVVASLQMIYGVAPQRNYTYNPKNATLYLNVTDQELEKIKAKVAELQKEQDAKAAEKKAN